MLNFILIKMKLALDYSFLYKIIIFTLYKPIIFSFLIILKILFELKKKIIIIIYLNNLKNKKKTKNF